jgi:hypothetical protein
MASGQIITDYLSYGSGAPSGAPSLGAAGQYAVYEDTATGDLYAWDLFTTAWVRIWNHAVPGGPTGPTGATGATSATGPTGAPGGTGPTGAVAWWSRR